MDEYKESFLSKTKENEPTNAHNNILSPINKNQQKPIIELQGSVNWAQLHKRTQSQSIQVISTRYHIHHSTHIGSPRPETTEAILHIDTALRRAQAHNAVHHPSTPLIEIINRSSQ